MFDDIFPPDADYDEPQFKKDLADDLDWDLHEWLNKERPSVAASIDHMITTGGSETDLRLSIARGQVLAETYDEGQAQVLHDCMLAYYRMEKRKREARLN